MLRNHLNAVHSALSDNSYKRVGNVQEGVTKAVNRNDIMMKEKIEMSTYSRFL